MPTERSAVDPNDRAASTLSGLINTPLDPSSIPAGPDSPTPTPTGVTGKARWDFVSSQAPRGMKPLGEEWDTWIRSLPEDAADIEYTQLLRQAKRDAAAREQQRKQTLVEGDPNYKPLWQKALEPPNGRLQKKSADGVLSKKAAPVTGALPGSPGFNKPDPHEELQHRLETKGAPIIQGLPVSVSDVGLNDPDNPGAKPDPHVEQWVEGRNLELSNQQAAIAAKNGRWVYTGEVADPQGGKNYKRSLYVYFEDAQAQVAGFSPGEIKKYQRQLGLPESGVLDSTVSGLWDKAVASAQRYAMAGQKVELKFLFDQIVAGEVAKKAAGGGGGGAFNNESGADMVGADYYQAMMSVLGDISGVGKVG